jgi:hypothetical protein
MPETKTATTKTGTQAQAKVAATRDGRARPDAATRAKDIMRRFPRTIARLAK